MANRLALESSPYLLQHAANPVDWYAWGTEALERARREDKPILLSIGYAACHWCHVMAHESFENAETAALMNALFVNIKVDREERPDLDSIYMQAVQAMTGQGGWPMTVFLTPACEPFYGGTYFPPRDRHGLPSFGRILQAVADAYREKRASVEATAAQLREMYEKITLPPTQSTAGHELTPALLDRAVHGLVQAFDADNGGFGGAPKFPPSMSLDFLLQQSARSARTGDEALDIVRRSFLAMARGGIYDQVGGGLHRYSVDERWLVPHFEKMLYDNALFVRLGSHLWQVTRDPEVHRVVSETIAWAAREMMSAEGGFYSSLDADSEGEEGRFYVWSAAGFDAGAGDDAELLSAVWGVTPEGNFEGKNILHVAAEPSTVAVRSGITPRDMEHRMNLARLALRAIREQRVRPGRDDKVLAGWNGLMLRALADAARIFDDDDFATLALRNASFLSRELVQDGEVRRTWKEGRRSDVGFLEDHAAVALGFLELYALTFDRDWVGRAREIAESIRRRFLDPSRGVLFDTPSEHEELLTRPRDLTDNALPAGNSLASELFLRLGILLDDVDYRTIAVQQVEPLGEGMGRYPSAFGHLLSVADMMVHGAVEVVIAGVGAPPATASEGRVRTLTRIVAETYVPSLVLAGVGGSASGGAVSSERQVIEGESAVTEPEMHQGLLADRLAAPGGGMAYVCRRYVCDAPTSEPEVLSEQLRAAART